MSEAAFAFMLAAICASLALALEYRPKPIRADPTPVALCPLTEPQVVDPDTYDLPPTEQQLRRGGFYKFYPCKMLKKEQDV